MMAIPSRSFLSFLILSSLLFLLTSPPATADEGNILLTGDILTTDSQLSYLDYTFVMQDDCNLVLYNKRSGFQSGTHGFGVNCSLSLNDLGQFIIKSGDGSTVWTSTPTITTKAGKYAAVLQPDGQVIIYGPTVWSTSTAKSTAGTGAFQLDSNIPSVRNVLFSSQILYDNSELATRDYTFIMKDDCNLELIKASAGNSVTWQSRTAGKGKNCFMRLDHNGQLAVVDDGYRAVWASKPVGKKYGDYVLIMQINGQAVVYGPAVWSTSSSRPDGITNHSNKGTGS